METRPALASRRAQELVAYLETAVEFPYASLVSAVTDGSSDTVVIDVQPELPQRRAVRIVDVERIRIEFPADDAEAPRAYAERDDFPIGLVHTNYSSADDVCWLCLWEEPWIELKGRLDPETLVHWVRRWLERTAAGANHDDGQPLEPVLQTASNTIVMPVGGASGAALGVGALHRNPRGLVLDLGPTHDERFGFAVFEITTPPSVQQAFARLPRTLHALEEIAVARGGGFIDRFRAWILSADRGLDAQILILLRMPKQAVAGGPVLETEDRAFQVVGSVGEVAVALGLRLPGEAGGAPVINLTPGPLAPERVALWPWRVVTRLDAAAARTLSGRSGGESRIVAIGAGALGSNLVAAAARTGTTTWTVIDDDHVLPHNTVRQAQDDAHVGSGKAASLAKLVNRRLSGVPVAIPIAADILTPDDKAVEVGLALSSADLVLDLTASPAALRHVARLETINRAASAFFGPDGSDLVVLSEDSERGARLDEVEAQYFWSVASDCRFDGHLDAGRLDFVRYANACQDLTRPLPPWKVLTLSAIAANHVDALSTDVAARIAMWRLREDGAISRYDMTVPPPLRAVTGGWAVTLSAEAAETMHRLRAAALPAETGGVLLGVVDLDARVAHVVGVLPAPRDSGHSPAFFVRGAKGLKNSVEGFVSRSAGMLSYLGEWHSHPIGCVTAPSPDDELLFNHLHRFMGPVAKPYMMCIVGDAGVWLRAAVSAAVEGEAFWAAEPSTVEH